MNETKSFFHLFADGALSAGFILSIKDYVAVMNIVAVCAANSGATVVAFSIEDTHPHFLLFATQQECVRFLEMFESIYRHFATRSLVCPVPFSSIGSVRQREILHTRQYSIPGDWLVAGDLILPTNYVDVQMFESIYKTHNAFRVFLSSNKSKDDEVRAKIAEARGVMLEDTEARQVCGDECLALFGNRNVRRLSPIQRLRLAQALRRKHRFSMRQLASVVRLPEAEVRRYVS